MKNKLFIFLMLTILLIVVGCSNTQALSSGEPPNLTGKIIIDEDEYQMIAGGYRWKAPNKEVLTDAASPNQIAEDFDAIPVTAGMDIGLEIEKRPSIKLNLWEEHAISEVGSFEKNHFVAPDKPGKYIYEATAIWANSTSLDGWTRGEVSYTFVIEVK